MIISKRNKLILFLVMVAGASSLFGFKIKRETYSLPKIYTEQETKLKLFEKERNNFTLDDRDECKLINSAIKQNYNIFFSGDIVEFDTLIIGKGVNRYLSSYIFISRDSIIFNKVTNIKTRKAYKHNLKLTNNLSINIERKTDSALVTITNENDTLKFYSDFVGMNNPFVQSLGSVINVNIFRFTCDDYYSDVFLFGDSYVNCASPARWPYYVYNKGYRFLCDGLPGGRSVDSYDFMNSAFSIHKPKYAIWCLGMNDGSDKSGTNLDWMNYAKKVMELCDKNNVTLILATVPTVPTRDNTGKNQFIRESGYEYIDFDKAVSDSNGNWKDGMLSNDGVHPTAEGAKALAEEFIKGFPKIR